MPQSLSIARKRYGVDAVSDEVARLMALAGIADDDESPRALATVLCISEGIEPREALERMGYDVPEEEEPAPPELVPFGELEEGQRFLLNSLEWVKAKKPRPSDLRENARGRGIASCYWIHVGPDRLVTPLL